MTTDNAPSEYAQRAVHHAESVELPPRPLVETRLMNAGIKAVTYALLELASAIREHGR